MWQMGTTQKLCKKERVKCFIGESCIKITRIVKTDKELPLHHKVKLVTNFCYMEDRLNAHGGSEAAVTERTSTSTSTDWIKLKNMESGLIEKKSISTELRRVV